MMLLAVALVPAAVYGLRRLFEVYPHRREGLRSSSRRAWPRTSSPTQDRLSAETGASDACEEPRTKRIRFSRRRRST
jgi:hypothetical protein